MSLKLWSTDINWLYLWSTAINQAYLWSTEVFTTGGGVTTISSLITNWNLPSTLELYTDFESRVTDLSGTWNNGTNNWGTFVTWKVWEWISFDWVNDRVTYGNIFNLTAYTNITFGFWIKPVNFSTRDTVISNYGQTTWGGWDVNLNTNWKLYFQTYNTVGATQTSIASTTLTAWNWHFVCFWLDVVSAVNKWFIEIDNWTRTTANITKVSPWDGQFAFGGEARVYWFENFVWDELFVFWSTLDSTQTWLIYNSWNWISYS